MGTFHVPGASHTATPSGCGPWSVSEVVEHVAITNGNMLRVLSNRLEPMTGPGDITDEEMPYLFYHGDEPPDAAKPTGERTDIDDAAQWLRFSAVHTWQHRRQVERVRQALSA